MHDSLGCCLHVRIIYLDLLNDNNNSDNCFPNYLNMFIYRII